MRIDAGGAALGADLTLPEGARGLILFAHGSGSGRMSPRNRAVARRLSDAGLGTLLLDLLTESEEAADDKTAELRFDIPFLARRLEDAKEWCRHRAETSDLPVAYFGASTGAAAALTAAAGDPEGVFAVVSRGGRPDLAGDALPFVRSPTLLIVGGLDYEVLELNRAAARRLAAPHRLEVVPGASHLFEEPGALQRVAALAKGWFLAHLPEGGG